MLLFEFKQVLTSIETVASFPVVAFLLHVTPLSQCLSYSLWVRRKSELTCNSSFKSPRAPKRLT